MTTTRITCLTSGGARLELPAASLGTPQQRERARVEANAWIKRLRLVTYGAATMRERFTYRGDSLWWFTELYLHKMKRLDTAVATALMLEAVQAEHSPARVIVESGDRVVRDVARAFSAARGLPIDVTADEPAGRPRIWPSYLIGVTTKLSRLRPPIKVNVRKSPKVAAFVHTAFWRTTDRHNGPLQETYIGPVLDAVARRVGGDDLFYVGVGPRRNFRARRWWDPLASAGARHPAVTPIERLAPRRTLNDALRFWEQRQTGAQEVVQGPGIRAAAEFQGIDLWPVLRPELESAALVQWPWSVRVMDEAAAALTALSPEVVVTYAEAGGWGRALVLEARRRGIRSVGLQHGFIYRHWLNYLHEADEMTPHGEDAGFPAPDRTLVFDGYTAQHLCEAGHLPVASLEVTGSARLDELAARVRAIGETERQRVRVSVGASDGDRVALLAAKFSELGPELDALVSAVAVRPEMRLVIKTHPAETPEPYRRAAASAANVTIAAADADLASLLAAADGVVTMNSTVAIDGLALDKPALVVGLPNNLSPFVDAGVMLGVAARQDPGPRLETLLYDQTARNALLTGARAFRQQHEMQADGRSAERAADTILSLAPGASGT